MRVSLLARRIAAPVSSPRAAPAGVLVRSFCADRDARDVARLGEALAELPRGRSSAGTPARKSRGLLAELTCRPGRQVEGWLGTIASPDTAGEQKLGLISLVACRSPGGIRHSIGWLVVHPAARRLGVGRALVAHACYRAAQLAAETLWVETRSDWPEAIAFWRAVGFAPQAPIAPKGAPAPGVGSPDMLDRAGDGYHLGFPSARQKRSP